MRNFLYRNIWDVHVANPSFEACIINCILWIYVDVITFKQYPMFWNHHMSSRVSYGTYYIEVRDSSIKY